MNARIFNFLLLIPVQLLGQCVTNDFGVAYHGNTVFTINSQNNTCACLSYHSSGPATFGTVETGSLNVTRADVPTTVAGPAEFGSDASFAGSITAGRKQPSTCTTSLRDALVFRLDAAKAEDAGPYGIAVTPNGVMCNQTVGGISGVCMLSGLMGLTQNGVAVAAVFPAGGSARTICSWGYLSGVNGNQRMFSFGNNNTPGANMYIGARNSDVVAGTRGDDVAAPDPVWTAGVWNHLCAAYDGVKLRIFWNGQQAASVTKAWSLPKPLAAAAIGAQVDNSETWHGALYDTRVYARSLAAGEVLTLYRATLNNAGDGCDYVYPDAGATVFGSLAAAGGLRTGSGSDTTISGLAVSARSHFVAPVTFSTAVTHHSDVRFDGASVTVRGNLTVGGPSSFAAPVGIAGGLTVSGGGINAQAVTAAAVTSPGLATLGGGMSVAAGQDVKIAASGSGVSSVQIGSASSASSLSVFGDIYHAYPGRLGLSISGTCSSVSAGSRLNLTCPAGQTIVSIIFSSWGTPSGSCGSALGIGSCHAATSESYLTSQCLGTSSCTPLADPASPMGDPCPGTTKVWTAQVSCGRWSDAVVDSVLQLQSRLATPQNSCPTGYALTGFGAGYQPVCTDINECATNNGGCSPLPGLATCTNTAGSFTCSGCKWPYLRQLYAGAPCTGLFRCNYPQASVWPDISPQWLNLQSYGTSVKAALIDSEIQLTSATGSQVGVVVFDLPQNLKGQSTFHAEWLLYIGGGTSTPADGYSFIYSSLIGPTNTDVACEQGAFSGNGGLTVSFVHYTINQIRIYQNSVQVAYKAQNPVCSWCKVEVDVARIDASTTQVSVKHSGTVIHDKVVVTNFNPDTSFRMGFCARTGGNYAIHQIDDLLIY
eukprot:TRINITY_DN315_c0_g1_i2.p1 TRINITY_DN315_c0_g1~~TRINITY_DN315_c0_g1_i2.p1  ORF type:complete len:877 (+),score=225.99 TRINITY_DN315_c0_g1_i2:102-2732(+)